MHRSFVPKRPSRIAIAAPCGTNDDVSVMQDRDDGALQGHFLLARHGPTRLRLYDGVHDGTFLGELCAAPHVFQHDRFARGKAVTELDRAPDVDPM